jgi:hypothetical protein
VAGKGLVCGGKAFHLQGKGKDVSKQRVKHVRMKKGKIEQRKKIEP